MFVERVDRCVRMNRFLWYNEIAGSISDKYINLAENINVMFWYNMVRKNILYVSRKIDKCPRELKDTSYDTELFYLSLFTSVN